MDASLLAINDSAVDGATAASSHPFGKFLWKSTTTEYPQNTKGSTQINKGTGWGDCVGSDGVAYPGGKAAFSKITLQPLGKTVPVAIDVTAIVNWWLSGKPNFGMTLIGSAGSISNFGARTQPNGPMLSMTFLDGTVTTIPCAANRSIAAPGLGATSAVIDCTAGAGSLLLRFNMPAAPSIASATLNLTGMTRGTSNTISVYATDLSHLLADAPVPPYDPVPMEAYRKDLPTGVPSSGILYAEDWRDLQLDSRNYYQRSSSGTAVGPNLSIVGAIDPDNGLYSPPAPGLNALKIKMLTGKTVAMNLVWPFYGVWGYCPTDAWLEFYLMLGDDWPFTDSASSGPLSKGKFPFSLSCHTPPRKPNSPIGRKLPPQDQVPWNVDGVPPGGNGGDPSTGANQWSMRPYWFAPGKNVDPAVFGPLAAAGYWLISAEDAYSADQYGPYGDDNFWTSERTIAALMKKNTWHKIKIHIKLNTLWIEDGPCPDPVYLGDVRRMPYRLPTDPLVNDQMGRDTKIVTLDRFLYFGDKTGWRYTDPAQPLAVGDTRILRSDQLYNLPSMLGRKNGLYEVYVDEVLAHRRTDMRWRHIPDVRIDCLWFDFGQTQLVTGKEGSVYMGPANVRDGQIEPPVPPDPGPVLPDWMPKNPLEWVDIPNTLVTQMPMDFLAARGFVLSGSTITWGKNKFGIGTGGPGFPSSSTGGPRYLFGNSPWDTVNGRLLFGNGDTNWPENGVHALVLGQKGGEFVTEVVRGSNQADIKFAAQGATDCPMGVGDNRDFGRHYDGRPKSCHLSWHKQYNPKRNWFLSIGGGQVYPWDSGAFTDVHIGDLGAGDWMDQAFQGFDAKGDPIGVTIPRVPAAAADYGGIITTGSAAGQRVAWNAANPCTVTNRAGHTFIVTNTGPNVHRLNNDTLKWEPLSAAWYTFDGMSPMRTSMARGSYRTLALAFNERDNYLLMMGFAKETSGFVTAVYDFNKPVGAYPCTLRTGDDLHMTFTGPAAAAVQGMNNYATDKSMCQDRPVWVDDLGAFLWWESATGGVIQMKPSASWEMACTYLTMTGAVPPPGWAGPEYRRMGWDYLPGPNNSWRLMVFHGPYNAPVKCFRVS